MFNRRLLFVLSLTLCTFLIVAFSFDAKKETTRNPEWNNYTDITLKTGTNLQLPLKRYTGTAHPGNGNYPTSYPGSTMIAGTASYRYNCHAFAWLYGGSLTGLTESQTFELTDNEVINTLRSQSCCSIIVSDVTVDQLTSSNYLSLLQVGDIILYKPDPTEYNPYSYVHSAVITGLSSSITVISKWSEFEVYIHDAANFEHATVILSSPYLHSVPRTVSVYRRTHGTANQVLPVMLNSSTYKYNSGVTQITGNNQSHASTCSHCGLPVYESHTFVQVGRFNKCTLCNYTYSPGIDPFFSGDEEQ